MDYQGVLGRFTYDNGTDVYKRQHLRSGSTERIKRLLSAKYK